MGHGVDERALQRRVAAGDLGGEGLLAQPLPADGQPDLGGGQGEQPGLATRRLGPVGGARPPQGTDRCAVRLEADLVAMLAARAEPCRQPALDSWRPSSLVRPTTVGARVRPVRPDPGRLASVGHEHLDDRRRRPDWSIARVRDRPLPAGVLERAPDAVHPRVSDEAARDGRQRDVRAVGGEGACDPVQGLGLGGTRLGLRRAVRPDPRQPPDDERDEQEQDEVEPLRGSATVSV